MSLTEPALRNASISLSSASAGRMSRLMSIRRSSMVRTSVGSAIASTSAPLLSTASGTTL